MLYTLKYKNFVINGPLGGLGEVQDLPRWAEIEELVAKMRFKTNERRRR